MNKLVQGAKYSPRNTREQQLREAIRNGHRLHGDVRRLDDMWGRAGEALHKNDPDERKLAQLLKEKP